APRAPGGRWRRGRSPPASAPKICARRRARRRASPARWISSRTWAPIASSMRAAAGTSWWRAWRRNIPARSAPALPSRSIPRAFICSRMAGASTDAGAVWTSRAEFCYGSSIRRSAVLRKLNGRITGAVHATQTISADLELFFRHLPARRGARAAGAGAAQVIQTMMAGENQIATAGGSGVVDANFAGADLVAVAGMVNMPAFYIVVQPEIKTLQDLRGKPVGITRFGSSTDFTMRYILRKAGLEPDKDVPLLQLGGQPEL